MSRRRASVWGRIWLSLFKQGIVKHSVLFFRRCSQKLYWYLAYLILFLTYFKCDCGPNWILNTCKSIKQRSLQSLVGCVGGGGGITLWKTEWSIHSMGLGSVMGINSIVFICLITFWCWLTTILLHSNQCIITYVN